MQSGLKVGDTWSKLRGHAINTIVGATALTEAIRESCTHPKRSRPIRLGLYSHEGHVRKLRLKSGITDRLWIGACICME